MLERTQVFVDTSYLLASFYNSWETGARAQLEIDLPEVVGVLGRMIEQQLKQPVQRQMWYDGIPDSGPHRYQRALRTCDGVQLRAGQLIEWGERRTQKAVDTRLVADLVLAGVRGQCSDIVLVSGDADMIPGVQEAANAGLRVHLYGFGWIPCPPNCATAVTPPPFWILEKILLNACSCRFSKVHYPLSFG